MHVASFFAVTISNFWTVLYCLLTVKHSVTANEFITRMLYKDMY